MNLRRPLFVFSMMVLLPACTSPVSPALVTPEPLADPALPGTPGLTATWTTTTPELSVQGVTAASAGEEAAVAYVEWGSGEGGGEVQSRALLQRLDAAGIAVGPPVELAAMQGRAFNHLTLATDGARYLACWEQAGQIACATVPLGEGAASAALTVAGFSPAVAFGAGGFALAYGVTGHVAIERVGSDGQRVGAPVTVAMEYEGGVEVLLAPTRIGFALARGVHSREVHVHLLDIVFKPVAETVDLGVALWSTAALTATDTRVAVGVARPYEGQLFLIEDGKIGTTHNVPGGGKMGLNLALAADGAAVSVISADDHQGLRHWSVDGDVLSAPKDPEEADFGSFERGSFAALRLHGEMFVAASRGAGEIIVARVRRP